MIRMLKILALVAAVTLVASPAMAADGAVLNNTFGAGLVILGAGYGVAWACTANGVSDTNTLQFFRAVARTPLIGPLGAGAGYSWYSRKTTYSRFFEARKTQSEWRVFLNAGFPFPFR